MKNFNRKLTPLHRLVMGISLLALTACGGGSSGSSTEEASPGSGGSSGGGNAGGGNTAQVPTELKIDRDNELRNVNDLSITVEMTASKSFLSICPDPGGKTDVSSFDYGSCMIRSPLDMDLMTFTLPLPNHLDRLVAIVWYYEPGKEPLVKRWKRASGTTGASGSIWSISEAG